MEQDNIIHLHHKDIVNCTCTVNVEKLTQSDIWHAEAIHHDSPPPLSSSSGVPTTENKETDPDWAIKKQKKKSTRPGTRPSTQHIVAQCMIEECNRHRKHKDYMPTQILRTLPEATSAQLPIIPGTGNSHVTTSLQESPGNVNVDSRSTIEATRANVITCGNILLKSANN